MFVDKTGKMWSSEKRYREALKQRGEILEFQLALECYSDDTGDELTEVFRKIADFRENLTTATEEQVFIQCAELKKLLIKTVNQIGKDKFMFHPNGFMEYRYPKNK